MVSPSTNNPCIRCGKQRIIAREWKETIKTLSGPSVVTYQLTVCPDPDCQKIVEEKQALQKAKQDEITKAFKERAAARLKNGRKTSKKK